jgi:hypothetical protein
MSIKERKAGRVRNRRCRTPARRRFAAIASNPPRIGRPANPQVCMTYDEIISAAADLDDDELRRLEHWIRAQLDPPMSGRTPIEHPAGEHLSYRLKFFRCGNAGCRCARGRLHGPYLFATRHTPEGGHRQFYIGRVAMERPDDERQLELDFH